MCVDVKSFARVACTACPVSFIHVRRKHSCAIHVSTVISSNIVDLQVLSRASTLDIHISSAEDLEAAAIAVLDKELATAGRLRLRLMGVRLSSLRSTSASSSGDGDEAQADTTQIIHHPGPLDRFLDAARARDAEWEEYDTTAGTEERVTTSEAGGAAADEQATGVMRCPVCDGVLAPGTDANQHLDACLSKRAIRDLVEQSRNIHREQSQHGSAHDSDDERGGKRRKTKGKTSSGPLDAFVIATSTQRNQKSARGHLT